MRGAQGTFQASWRPPGDPFRAGFCHSAQNSVTLPGRRPHVVTEVRVARTLVHTDGYAARAAWMHGWLLYRIFGGCFYWD
jgi:hypothetical protein